MTACTLLCDLSQFAQSVPSWTHFLLPAVLLILDLEAFKRAGQEGGEAAEHNSWVMPSWGACCMAAVLGSVPPLVLTVEVPGLLGTFLLGALSRADM